MADHVFVNPYNFVSVELEQKQEASRPTDEKELHTGILYCALRTKTPLAVPDSGEKISDDKIENHKHYPFFRYGKGSLVIPGSTLRGAIRSMYEAVTDSCFSTARYDLERFGQKKPCDSEKLCKACTLFGMTSQNFKSGSRIRITDAELCSEGKTEEVTLRELMSPHASYIPFYYKDEKIRGRKFYWHSANNEYYKKAEKTETNATMELLASGEEFKFQIYYDQITTEQLKELIWTLTLGENEKEGNLCYKLGHGKAVGLGSVKIFLESSEERTFILDEGKYTIKKESFGKNVTNPFSDSSRINEILRISNFDTIKEKVEYPSLDWFNTNESVRKGLPGITDKNLTLPVELKNKME